MPLITCPECQKQVSDKAAACPQCGAPITGVAAPVQVGGGSHARVTRTGALWEGIGTVLVIGGGIVAFTANSPNATLAGVGAIGVGFVVFIIGRFL